MEHEAILKEWELDSQIDKTNVLESMYRTPILHSKYITKLTSYKVLQRKKYVKYETLKSQKTKYFQGLMTKEELDELGWKQYQLKTPLKSEMEMTLSNDFDIQKIKNEIHYLDIIISTLESILKDIQSRNFLYKSIVEMIKFEAGA